MAKKREETAIGWLWNPMLELLMRSTKYQFSKETSFI
jgi:hypothetical protein